MNKNKRVYRENKGRKILGAGLLVLTVIIFAVLIRSYFLQSYYIPTSSMEPTLVPDDRIIVSRMTLVFGDIERGDVIAFIYPLDRSQTYVKRVIGLPGEVIEVKNNGVYINGRSLEEPYLPDYYEYESEQEFLVTADNYYVLGDNRPLSEDSRYWGTVPEENVLGRVELIYWPMSNFGRVD